MKNGLITLAVLVIFCWANPAVAAPDPFSDVPLNHWAYDAVKKLAEAGFVSGSDGIFRGDRVISRYEMAVIVGNAMTKADKADAANKALIDQLAAEFAAELNTLGKRVETLEKKQGPLKIDGWFKYRYEYVKRPHNNSVLSGTSGAMDKVRTRNEIWVNIDNQFDGRTYFHGSLQNESASDSISGGNAIQVKESFVGYKTGRMEIAAGRFFPTIGKGTLLSTPLMDGGRLSFGTDVKTTLYAMNFAGLDINYTAADIQFNLSRDSNMTLAYLADKDKENYDSIAMGMEHKANPAITLSAEYGVNKSDLAKTDSGKSNPYAYFIKAQYKGANPFVAGSSGFAVQYKKAVPGFDRLANAAPPAWNAPFNWTAASGGGMADDIKGFEYSVEATLAPRLVFSVAYDDLKTFDGNETQKFMTAQMFYLF